MTAATELRLQISKVISHPVEKVFDAWLDPKMLAKFMKPGPGMTVPEATSDARVGGRFRIVMRAPEAGDLPHQGTYKKITPHDQIVFTWESPFSQIEDSTVTLDFVAKGAGTLLTLTHVRFDSEESRDNHEGGWTAILAAVEGAL
jgi:uncharacterized protein YndB with AHSA1/START domain